MTVLADGALQNLPGKIMTAHILDLVEMAGGAIVRATEKVRLAGWMNKVFFRVGIRPINDVPGVQFECWWRSRLVSSGIDQMAGGTSDPFNLYFPAQDLLVDLI